jgi:hypothetical protein
VPIFELSPPEMKDEALEKEGGKASIRMARKTTVILRMPPCFHISAICYESRDIEGHRGAPEIYRKSDEVRGTR